MVREPGTAADQLVPGKLVRNAGGDDRSWAPAELADAEAVVVRTGPAAYEAGEPITVQTAGGILAIVGEETRFVAISHGRISLV